MADTVAPTPSLPEEENPFAARLKADPNLGEVSVTERVRLNFVDSRNRGTLLGAGALMKLPSDAKGGQEVTDEFGNPIGVAPPSQVAADRYDAITADLLRYEATPSFTSASAGELTAALIGQLGGGLTSPEAFITRIPGLTTVVEKMFPKAVQWGASLVGREASEAAAETAGRVVAAGATQAAVQGAVNPAIQTAEMQTGLRDEFSKTEFGLAVGLGGLIGGGLGGAHEAVAALRARRAPAEQIASAEATAQFSDLVHAETSARERAVFAAEDPSMRSADTPDLPTTQQVEPSAARPADPVPPVDGTADAPRPADAPAVVADPEAAAAQAAAAAPEPTAEVVLPEQTVTATVPRAEPPPLKAATRSAWGEIRDASAPAEELPAWFLRVRDTLDALADGLGMERPRLLAGKPRDETFPLFGTNDRQGNILLSDSLSEHHALNNGVHEFGHEVQFRLYDAAPAETKDAIQEAFRAAAQRDVGNTSLNQLRPVTATRNAGDAGQRRSVKTAVRSDEPIPASNPQSPYIHGFDEWFAEQVSRWVTTTEKPVGVVDQFFSGIADVWRRIYEKISGHTPLASEVKAFLDRRWEGAEAGQIAREARSAVEGGDAGVITAGRPMPAADPEARLEQWKASNPLKTVPELMARAEENKATLASAIDAINKETGADGHIGPNKLEATVHEKLARKGYPDAGHLTDVVRGGFKAKTPEQADAIIAGLAKRFDVIDEGWAVTFVGYADRKALVRFDDGSIGEIQIWEPTLLDAKQNGGHELYTRERALPEGPEKTALQKKMMEHYAAAADSLGPSWKALLGKDGKSGNLAFQAASDTTRPSIPTSELSALAHAPLENSQASPGAQTTGLPSKIPYLTSETSLSGGDRTIAHGNGPRTAPSQPENTSVTTSASDKGLRYAKQRDEGSTGRPADRQADTSSAPLPDETVAQTASPVQAQPMRFVQKGSESYLTKADGSDILGAITPEISKDLGREAAPIRLIEGRHDDVTGEGFGAKHIEARHGEEIRRAGYPDVGTLVADVAENFSEIRKGVGGRLMLVKPDRPSRVAVIELRKGADGTEYSVTSAGFRDARYLAKKGREKLWEGGRRPPLSSPEGAPLIRTGQSEGNVVQSGPSDNGIKYRKGDGDAGAGQPPQSGEAASSGGPVDIEPVLSLQQQAQALADALDVPLRQGRVTGGKTALGQYDAGQDVVRSKSIADFATMAHEAGHTLEKRIGPDLTKLINRHANELGRLDYDAARLDAGEGFAEWLRAALTNPAFGEKQAPEFAKAFREFMTAREPEILAHLDAAAAAHQAWLNAPTDMKLEAIVRPPSTEWEKAKAEIKSDGMAQTVGLALQKIAAATYERIFDDKAPVARAVRSMVRSIRDATGVRVALQGGDNPEALARQFQRAQQAAVRDMLDGVRPYHGVVPEGPSLRDALITATGEPGILGRWNEAKVAAFDQYLVARRSEALYGKVARGEMERRPLAMSAVDVSNAMLEAERANPGFREASDQIHDFTRQLLRKQYEGGLIDADLYARLMAEEFYVPMFRHMDDKPSPAGVGGSDGPGTVQTIKRMRGSDRDIIPPTQSLMTQAFLVNRTLAHNDIIKSFVQLARRAKDAGAVGTGRILEEIPATQMVGKKFDLAEAVASKAREAGMDRDDLAVLTGALTDVFGEDPLMATIFRSEPTGKRGEPLVFWKEGGQLRAVRLQSKDEGLALYETLAGLPPAARDMAIQFGVVTSQALRAGITTNPTFAITNFIRDQLAVGILRSDYVPFYSGAKGLKSEARQDEWAQLYSYAGGVSPGAGSAGLSDLINRDVDALARKGWATQKIGGLADLQRGHVLAPFKAVAESVEIAESGARLAVMKSVFEQKKRQGLSDYDALIEAGYQATDLMDFGRHGSGTLYLRTLVPFLNAHLQGLDKARRTLVEPLWRAARGDILTDADAEALRNAQLGIAKMLGVGGALGVGYGLWASSHEAYQDANVELRASHLIIPGDAFGREGKILVIPKPFELAMGFNLGEALGTYLATKDPRTAHFAMEGMREVIQPPNPLTGIPLVKTSAELTLNKSFFTGRDIVPERLLNKENPRFEVKPNTTALARQIGDALNISPIKVDYAVGSMFGNWGRDVMAASNVTDPNAPATSKEDQMFFRRFIKGADRTSETTRQWWEAAGRQNGTFVQANNRYGDLLKAFQDSQAADYLASLPSAQKAYVIMNSAGTEDGKASFSADDKRLHPLMRGANAVTVANDYIQELSRNAQKAYEGGERQAMDPTKRRDVIDALRVLSAMEQRNALVMLKQKGYEGRPLLSTEDQFKVLSAISPEAGAEIATRYATAKILPTATVARLWPDAEKRLLADGGQAELRELSSDAKADGYAFGGERVTKPQKRRVVIDPTMPPPPPARAPVLQPNPFQ